MPRVRFVVLASVAHFPGHSPGVLTELQITDRPTHVALLEHDRIFRLETRVPESHMEGNKVCGKLTTCFACVALSIFFGWTEFAETAGILSS